MATATTLRKSGHQPETPLPAAPDRPGVVLQNPGWWRRRNPNPHLTAGDRYFAAAMDRNNAGLLGWP